MKGSDWAKTLPPRPGVARERAILRAVRAGDYVLRWSPVTLRLGTRTLQIEVSSDVLRIGDAEDSVRVATTCRTAQLVADEVGAVLLTPAIVDAIWQQADHRVPVMTQPGDSTMADTSRFLLHHQRVEDWITRERIDGGLIANVGKEIVLHSALWNRPDRCAIYGWFDGVGRPIQRLNYWSHCVDFTDYENMPRFARRRCVLNGQPDDLGRLYQDPEIGPMLADQALRGFRHPGVSAETPLESPAEPDPYEDPPDTGKPPQAPSGAQRSLSRGMSGADVSAWQRVLVGEGYDLGRYGPAKDGVDGNFGRLTEDATKAYQRAHGLPATGVVDDATLGAVGSAPQPTSWLDSVQLIQAANYTRAGRTVVHWEVLHSTENPPLLPSGTIRPGVARNVALWFGGRTQVAAPRASSHYVVGGGPDVASEVFQCVDEADVAWAAPGANRYGVQHEIVGQCLSTDWSGAVMRPTLERAAALVARSCQRWGIPVQSPSRDALREARALLDAGRPLPDRCRGIITHADATAVWRQSTHCDPGGPSNSRWPMALFLDLVKSASDGRL